MQSTRPCRSRIRGEPDASKWIFASAIDSEETASSACLANMVYANEYAVAKLEWLHESFKGTLLSSMKQVCHFCPKPQNVLESVCRVQIFYHWGINQGKAPQFSHFSIIVVMHLIINHCIKIWGILWCNWKSLIESHQNVHYSVHILCTNVVS